MKGESVPTFLIVGTPDRRKGFDRIRPVIDDYHARYGPCKVIIVSRCSDSLKAGLGLMPPLPDGTDVEWRCNLSDAELFELYQRVHVLFHPARYESFGLPFIEAAAVGTPVVSTEVGAAPDLLIEDLSAFIVDGDDAAACSQALHRAWQEVDDCGIRLQQRYLDGYTRERMVETFLRLVSQPLKR